MSKAVFSKFLFYSLLVFFLLIGIINPQQSNTLNMFITSLVFAFATYTAFANNKLLVVPTLLLGLLFYSVYLELNLAILLGLLSGIFIALIVGKLKVAIKYSVFILISLFLINSGLNSLQLRNTLNSDLSGFAYNNDPGVYLKTFYFMENGLGYYESHKLALEERFTKPGSPKDIWSYRLPTLFYIWKLLPTDKAISVYILFLITASLFIYAAYLIAEKYIRQPYSILSPYLLLAYLHYPARDMMFLMTDYWSVMTFIVGLYFLISKNYKISTFLFTITILIRELYVLPISLMLIYFFFMKRKKIVAFLVPILAFLILLFIHALLLSNFINSWGTLLNDRIIERPLLFIQQTLAYGSWEYLLFRLRPFVILFAFAALGCFYLYKRASKTEAVVWTISLFAFPIAFLRYASSHYNDYWGILYVPTLLILSPLVLNFLKIKNDD